MKFSTFFTTAILLLSAAADAFPQPAADSTSLTLNPLPHSKRDPAATAPRRTTKATTRTSKTRAKSAGVSKTKATTAGKRKSAAATTGNKRTKQKASSSSSGGVCLLPSARGKKGSLGKRGCGDEKEKLTNCSLCPGLRKRGKGQRNKKKNVLLLTDPPKDNVDDLVDDTDCWQCTGPGGQAIRFSGTQVKRTAVDALKRNLDSEFITYARTGQSTKNWPHPYENGEGALPAFSGEVNKYITFPLKETGLYTGNTPGAFRVTIGLSNTNVPQTVNVMRHPEGDTVNYVKVPSDKGKK